MPEFVERPPQPHPLTSYSSNLKVLRNFKDVLPQTLSFSQGLRNQRDFIPQVQQTTREDVVKRCERLEDKSEKCRRAMNVRHFPMLRLMDKGPYTSGQPEVVSHPTAAGSPRPPQRVMRALKRCDPSAEVAQRPRRVSYPATLAQSCHTDDKFVRTELKSAFEHVVEEPKVLHNNRGRKIPKPFMPSNPRQARNTVASKYANVRETWNGDEWLGHANAASAYSPRDRALRGVIFSSRSPRRGSFVPHAKQGTRSGRPLTTESGSIVARRQEERPPFCPSSPSKAKYNIKAHYFLHSPLRSGRAEREEDLGEMYQRIRLNSQRFNDKLFAHVHGRERARQSQVRRGHRARSVDPWSPRQ